MSFTLNKRYHISINSSNAYTMGYVYFKEVYRVVASNRTFYPSGNILKMVYNAIDNYFVFIDGNNDTLFAFDNTDYYDCQFYGVPYSYTSQSNVESMISNGFLSYTSVDEYFILFQLNGEKHIVNKSDYIIFYDELSGSFKEQIDITNPSILIQYAIVPECNYVYIPSLNRYYFVKKITCVRNKLFQLDLHVDVLYTFNDDIRLQDVFVTRNQNTYEESLFDNRLPTKNIPTIDYIDVNQNYGTSSSAVNVTFNQSTFGYNWVLDALSSKISAVYGTLNPPTNATDLPVIASNKVDTNVLYAMNGTNAISFSKAIFKNSALASYVNSFILFPFDVTDITTYGSSFISLNDLYLDYSDNTFKSTPSTYATSRKLLTSNIGYVIIADFNYDVSPSYSFQKFMLYEPYTNYQLYIPFVGWVTIKSNEFIGKRILIYYGVDISTGFATAYIRNYTDGKVIFSTPCQLGIKLPINTSNAEELIRQKQNNVLNMNLGLISSGVATGIGATSGNPVSIVGGVLSGTKTIASIVNSENMMFERAQTTFTSTETTYYDVINKVWLKRITHEVLYNPSVFNKLNGHPLNRYTSLNSLTGYTEIGEIHYAPSTQLYITKNEIDEIETIVKNGIIL